MTTLNDIKPGDTVYVCTNFGIWPAKVTHVTAKFIDADGVRWSKSDGCMAGRHIGATRRIVTADDPRAAKYIADVAAAKRLDRIKTALAGADDATLAAVEAALGL